MAKKKPPDSEKRKPKIETIPINKIDQENSPLPRESWGGGSDPCKWEVVEDYKEKICQGKDLSEVTDVTLFRDKDGYLYVADGRHRITATIHAADIPEENEAWHCDGEWKSIPDTVTIKAKVHEGSLRDATLFACGANDAHGLPRTTRDKRKVLFTCFTDPELGIGTWSDGSIAEVCRVSQSTVSRTRSKLLELANQYERLKWAGLNDRYLCKKCDVDIQTVRLLRTYFERTTHALHELNVRKGRDGKVRNISNIGKKSYELPVVTDADWEEKVTNAEKPVLVYVYKDTCPHCADISKWLPKLSQKYRDDLSVYKTTEKESEENLRRFGFSLWDSHWKPEAWATPVPRLSLFHEGKEVDHHLGSMYQTELRELIHRWATEEPQHNADPALKMTSKEAVSAFRKAANDYKISESNQEQLAEELSKKKASAREVSQRIRREAKQQKIAGKDPAIDRLEKHMIAIEAQAQALANKMSAFNAEARDLNVTDVTGLRALFNMAAVSDLLKNTKDYLKHFGHDKSPLRLEE